ncbi:DUF6261 family protein [Labilibaculum euxinus]|uniref:Uncharacterized protein n=1 Tax=Labilibaculum euxinus TaxID=2686357 RepID=A0A7M4D0R5_9BACT|nr:DUF6261 family protein [Labilibaculum euxinus]MUP36244.1 hypothetical protein [Labilibaculum euxinus]MVB05449.1 hypothetical protein [Labilibaculum euxinus]
MNQKIFHYCNTSEISTVATNLLIAFSKGDWSADMALSSILANLGTENVIFTKSIRFSKSGTQPKILHEKDEIADQLFICTKQFIWANTYAPEKDIAEKAQRIWSIFDSNNLNLHRQSYESQMALTKSLIENINHPDVRPSLEMLAGVPHRFDAFTAASEDFRSTFVEFQQSVAGLEKVTPASTQKNVIRKIINEQLTAYLDSMAVALPEKYAAINSVIAQHIESINTKARARKTRNTTAEPELNITE